MSTAAMTDRIVAWFPGQGSQKVGMGQDLVQNFAVARQTFEEASDALGLNLQKLCFEGPEADLMLTENTQPALLTVSIAAWRVFQDSTGLAPRLAAGHSLGEYSALVANGAIPFATAVRWVRERGAAMQRAVPVGTGGMAAILGLSNEAVELLCKKASERSESPVDPANFNAPGQVVVAGAKTGIDILGALLAEPGQPYSGGKKIDLPVSAPFHSRLMQPAREHMTTVISPKSIKGPLAFPYVPNCTARIHRTHEGIDHLLQQQIDAPVLWSQSVDVMLREVPRAITVEIGPGKVLQGLCKRIVKDMSDDFKPESGFSISDTESLRAFEKRPR